MILQSLKTLQFSGCNGFMSCHCKHGKGRNETQPRTGYCSSTCVVLDSPDQVCLVYLGR